MSRFHLGAVRLIFFFLLQLNTYSLRAHLLPVTQLGIRIKDKCIMYLASRISQSMRGKKHVNLGLWWNIVEHKLFLGQGIGDVPEKIMVYLGLEAWKEILFTACAKIGHWENYSYTNSPNHIWLLDLYWSILS